MGESFVTTISRIMSCFYDTYANLPTSGLISGSLGFATDRLVLYRWSGTAWQAINVHLSSGILGNRPNAATLPNGSLYYGTDTYVLYQVQAGAWQTITGSTLAILAVSDDLRNSNDTQRTSSAVSWTKKKEVLLGGDLPVCRIKFDLSFFDGGGVHAHAKIYKNGIAIGTEQTITNPPAWGNYTTYSEDFSSFVSGDLIQIYIVCHNAGDTISIRNMRFYYKKVVSVIAGDTLTTPLDTTTDPTITTTNQDP